MLRTREEIAASAHRDFALDVVRPDFAQKCLVLVTYEAKALCSFWLLQRERTGAAVLLVTTQDRLAWQSRLFAISSRCTLQLSSRCTSLAGSQHRHVPPPTAPRRLAFGWFPPVLQASCTDCRYAPASSA